MGGRVAAGRAFLGRVWIGVEGHQYHRREWEEDRCGWKNRGRGLAMGAGRGVKKIRGGGRGERRCVGGRREGDRSKKKGGTGDVGEGREDRKGEMRGVVFDPVREGMVRGGREVRGEEREGLEVGKLWGRTSFPPSKPRARVKVT